MDEARVIAQIRWGKLAAFGEIVEHYQAPIIRYLSRMTGNAEVGKDLAQDTFIQAYQGVSKIRSDVSLKAWLYRIATNNALKFHRRRRVLSFVPMEASEVPGSTTTPEDIDEKIVVGEALLQVPPERRVCLVLHFVEGLKCREIADVVGASEEAVRKRVARGSKDFRRAYGCSSGDHVA